MNYYIAVFIVQMKKKKTLFYTACLTKSLAPLQELVYAANWILSQAERLLKSLNTKSSI